jgi:hypothetical protein
MQPDANIVNFDVFGPFEMARNASGDEKGATGDGRKDGDGLMAKLKNVGRGEGKHEYGDVGLRLLASVFFE